MAETLQTESFIITAIAKHKTISFLDRESHNNNRFIPDYY